jgi:hypothetical protein
LGETQAEIDREYIDYDYDSDPNGDPERFADPDSLQPDHFEHRGVRIHGVQPGGNFILLVPRG